MSKAYEDLKAKRGKPTETVQLHTRHDITKQIKDLERELSAAEDTDRRNKGMAAHKPQAPGIAEKIAALEAEAEADAIPVTFVEIGKKAWRDLEDEHPPTEEQNEELAEGKLRHNPETFPAAAMAASCVEPAGLTAEDFEAMGEDFGEGEFERLWNACILANFQRRELPRSERAYAVRRSSSPRSGPPSD